MLLHLSRSPLKHPGEKYVVELGELTQCRVMAHPLYSALTQAHPQSHNQKAESPSNSPRRQPPNY